MRDEVTRDQPAPAGHEEGGVVVHRSRGEVAAQYLASIAQEAQPGDRLGSRADLRSRCGVSVGTFNEALRVAQSQGAITLRPGPGGGVFAARQPHTITLGNSVLALDSDPTSIAEAARVRDFLEVPIIEDALWHSSPADIVRMRSILNDMSRAADSADHLAFVRANWRLHLTIACVGPPTVLQSIYTSLLGLIESHTLQIMPSGILPLPDFVAERYRIHARLVEALSDRDHSEAMRVITEHNISGGPTATTGDVELA